MPDPPGLFESGPQGRPERAKRLKLTAEEKEARALERALARAAKADEKDFGYALLRLPFLSPKDKAEIKVQIAARAEAEAEGSRKRQLHLAAAALIADMEAREREGRRLHSVLSQQIEAKTAERHALMAALAYSPEQEAEIWARYPDKEAIKETEYGPGKAMKRDYAALADARMDKIERCNAEIEAARQEQVEISHAYARPELKAGYAAMSAWIEAASAAAAQRKAEAEAAAWNENDPSPRKARPMRRQQARIFITPRQPAPEVVEAAAPAEAGEAAAFETPSWIDEGEREPVIWDEPETAAQETPQEPRGGQVELRRDRPKARLRLPRRRPRSQSPRNPSPRPRRKPNPSPIRRRGQNSLLAPLRTSSIGLTRRNAPRAPKTLRRSRRLCMRSRRSTPGRRCGSWRNGRTTRRD
jgi:hypothetical protein